MNIASPSRKSPALPFSFCARVLGVVLLLGCSLASSFAASSFKGLGFLPHGEHSWACGISSDGLVVVGASDWVRVVSSNCSAGVGANDIEPVREAFRWTKATGMVGLGHLAGAPYKSSQANAVSSDGSVVVGWSHSQGFRWTAATGMAGLGSLPDGYYNDAFAVSGDGKVIVGRSNWKIDQALTSQAIRWTVTGGMVGLGILPGMWSCSAEGVSNDGSIVIGSTQKPLPDFASTHEVSSKAFRWTAAGGMVSLGHLRGGGNYSEANAISGDGTIIVGQSDSASGLQPFRWTAAGGMVGLGHLPGSTNDVARAVSGDGSVIVGESKLASSETAFIWDNVNGMRSLQSVLSSNYHLDLTGWKLTSATGVSADGKTIVGNGEHNGHDEAWVAHLDRPVNAPAGKERGK